MTYKEARISTISEAPWWTDGDTKKPEGREFSYISIYDKNFWEIAQVHGNGKGASAHNARLIAAAPELYEACRAFIEAWEKSLQLEKTDVALRMAKAALAKAEGDV